MSEPLNNNRVVLESINWRQALPFTHIFRTFRLAITPSKLILALVGVFACFFGGSFLDLIVGNRVVLEKPFYDLSVPADEIQKYIDSPTMVEFDRWRKQAKDQNQQMLSSALARHLQSPDKAQDLANDNDQAMSNLANTLETQQGRSFEIIKKRYNQSESVINKNYENLRKNAKDKKKLDEQYDRDIEKLRNARDFLVVAIKKSPRVAGKILQFSPVEASEILVRTDPDAKDQIRETQNARTDREELEKTTLLAESYDRIINTQGLGIFQSFLYYNILMFNSAIDSVLSAEFFSNPNFKSFDQTPGVPPGLVKTLGLSLAGLAWFVHVHWLYFIIYFLFCLAVWAIAGGAICRLVALHATRDEKIPWKEAVSFASKKFVSFFTAPLMPIIFILGCCIPLLLIGLIGAIPFLGELIVGIGFVLVLLISFALAMLIIGGIGGLGMLYPTIAVEGSDTFDAFSRSYSYVYGRPWRMIFYTLVAAIYGTLCFVFVKLAASLVFHAASSITGKTMNLADAAYAAPLGKLQAIWFNPSFSGPFFGHFYQFPLSVSEKIAGFFIAIWVFLLVGMVVAFAISFFFSGYTMIYLLLRRAVDSTELDEVYVEEFESRMPETLPSSDKGTTGEAPAAQQSSPSSTSPSDPLPPETGVSESNEEPQA
jgi:hypothetical protein